MRGPAAHGAAVRALPCLALACVAPILSAGGEPMPRITTDSRE